MRGISAVVIAAACSGTPAPKPSAPPRPPPPAPAYTAPAADLVSSARVIDLPVVPSFTPPPPLAGGEETVRALQLGAVALDHETAVIGYVTFVYDCLTEHEQKEIDADPTVCLRPYFLLADRVDADPSDAIRVVEVPRKPNKAERKNLSKQELQSWPSVPEYHVGDHVRVEGTWTLRSPHGSSDEHGLLVYADMKAVTP